jgi:hypothetical protein
MRTSFMRSHSFLSSQSFASFMLALTLSLYIPPSATLHATPDQFERIAKARRVYATRQEEEGEGREREKEGEKAHLILRVLQTLLGYLVEFLQRPQVSLDAVSLPLTADVVENIVDRLFGICSNEARGTTHPTSADLLARG